jgi:predicted Fe-Mo cluster-binding NifX family protein
MKIAISTSGTSIDAPYDPRFGRATRFCLYDEGNGDWETIPNPAVEASGGAGVQAARLIAQEGVSVVISGAFGPNAFDTLDTAGIKMYLAPPGENRTVSDLIKAYHDHQLEQAATPSRGGQRGGRRRRA